MIKDKKVFIIAEAGVNHNGSLSIAKRLVDVAARAGCDAVKFQTFISDRVATSQAPKAPYQRRGVSGRLSHLKMLKALELSPEDHKALASHCARRRIIFMSTPFDEESADLLERIGMKIFKIPSGEITNEPLIRHVAAKNRPIILSTGMSTLDEVARAIRWIKSEQPTSGSITLLHCVSAYPARQRDMNLRAILTLERKFRLPVGLSDHTLGIEASIAAQAMGAGVIEKHFTLSRRMKGPDHRASLEPKELAGLVRSIRNVEQALGDGLKEPAAGERRMRKIARRSIIACRDINPGDVMTKADITCKRPGTGIPPYRIGSVVGSTARRTIRKDELIRPSDLIGMKEG